MIAHNPLHGSGQAALPHWALALGDEHLDRCALAILSSIAVTPSGLCRPSALGMYTLRTGFARYVPRFSLSERSWRFLSSSSP
jgi:hypothetical protein